MNNAKLKRVNNGIMRKKMYKSGKLWVVASIFAFGVGLAGTQSVAADTTTTVEDTTTLRQSGATERTTPSSDDTVVGSTESESQKNTDVPGDLKGQYSVLTGEVGGMDDAGSEDTGSAGQSGHDKGNTTSGTNENQPSFDQRMADYQQAQREYEDQVQAAKEEYDKQQADYKQALIEHNQKTLSRFGDYLKEQSEYLAKREQYNKDMAAYQAAWRSYQGEKKYDANLKGATQTQDPDIKTPLDWTKEVVAKISAYEKELAQYDKAMTENKAAVEKYAVELKQYREDYAAYQAANKQAIADQAAADKDYQQKMAVYDVMMKLYTLYNNLPHTETGTNQNQNGTDNTNNTVSKNDQKIIDFLANKTGNVPDDEALKNASTIYAEHKNLLDSLLKAATNYHIFTKEFTGNTDHIDGNVAAEVLKHLSNHIGMNNDTRAASSYVAAVLAANKSEEAKAFNKKYADAAAQIAAGTDIANLSDAAAKAEAQELALGFLHDFYFQVVETTGDNAGRSDHGAASLHVGSGVDLKQFLFSDKFKQVTSDQDDEHYIDFDTEFEYYTGLSDLFKGITQTDGVTVDRSGGRPIVVDVTNTTDDYVVVNLSENDVNSDQHDIIINGLQYGKNGQTSRAVIINVEDTNGDGEISLNNTHMDLNYWNGTTHHAAEQVNFEGATVLWNFGNIEKLTMLNPQFYGQILAPNADFTITGGAQYDGNIIAKSVVDFQETHRWDFQGTMPPDRPTNNTTVNKPVKPDEPVRVVVQTPIKPIAPTLKIKNPNVEKPTLPLLPPAILGLKPVMPAAPLIPIFEAAPIKPVAPEWPTPPAKPEEPTTPGDTTPGEDVPPVTPHTPHTPTTPGEPEEPDWPELPDTFGDTPNDDQPSDDEDWPELPDTFGEEEDDEDYPELPDTFGEEVETPTPVQTSVETGKQVETTAVSENVLPQTGNSVNHGTSVMGMVLAALSSLGLFGMARRKQD